MPQSKWAEQAPIGQHRGPWVASKFCPEAVPSPQPSQVIAIDFSVPTAPPLSPWGCPSPILYQTSKLAGVSGLLSVRCIFSDWTDKPVFNFCSTTDTSRTLHIISPIFHVVNCIGVIKKWTIVCFLCWFSIVICCLEKTHSQMASLGRHVTEKATRI